MLYNDFMACLNKEIESLEDSHKILQILRFF
jgi:hypothetical protein